MKGKKIKPSDIEAAQALLASVRDHLTESERELLEKVSQVKPEEIQNFALTPSKSIELKTLQIIFASNIYRYQHPNR